MTKFRGKKNEFMVLGFFYWVLAAQCDCYDACGDTLSMCFLCLISESKQMEIQTIFKIQNLINMHVNIKL